MNINNKYFERAKQIVESNSTLISKNLKNLDYDKTRFGTVVSYDINTNLATVLLDGDDTEIPNLPNLSGAYLKADDTVLVNKIRGSLSNAYIDKNVTDPTRQQDWIEPTLLNGWVNYDTEYVSARYFKDALGIVHIQGLIKNGTTTDNTPLFLLPVGYRPLKRLIFSQMSVNDSCRVDITEDGNVRFKSGNNSWVSLTGMSFRAEQ